MSANLSIASLFLLFFITVLPLASCSKRPYTIENFRSLELTPKSISEFDAELKRGFIGTLVRGLQEYPATDLLYQEVYLKYLIGSVAIFGKVDEDGLRIIRESCSRRIIRISNLLDQLVPNNDLDTVAQFVAGHIGLRIFADLLTALMEENWNVMELLVIKVVGALKDREPGDGYRLMLKYLPMGRQYELIRTGEMSMRVIGNVYAGERNLSLRQIFLLARCSHNPDPGIREYIANKYSFFQQSLADDSTMTNIRRPCPDDIPALNDDVVCHISRFMDVETLVCVVPLVCRAWLKAHSSIVRHHAKIHDLYLLDLSHATLDSIHTIRPWKYYLRDKENSLEYFGSCIESGALSRTEPTHWLKCNLKGYLDAVMAGRTSLPRSDRRIGQYEAFIRLFGTICDFCKAEKPILGKPDFFTDEDYERAVHHFAYKRKWKLRLPESLIAGDMPKLFSIVEEDEELMKKLICRNFCSFEAASLALILCAQTRKVSDNLARLVFSETHLFRRLVAPKVVACSEYYNSIVDFGILSGVMETYHVQIAAFPQFLISLTLSFKNNNDMTDKIVTSIVSGLASPYSSKLWDIRRYFEEVPLESLMISKGYSAEEIEFLKGVMVRCGLM